MALYAIGDVQGCYEDLRRLLDKVEFDPGKDKLWFAGDLVNRGPQSLEVLRFVKSLGDRAITVLGNHDLHLLAMAAGSQQADSRDHTLDSILEAHDREELIDWLRHQPLLHHDKKRNFTIIHAGLAPSWDLKQAKILTREVESALQSDDHPWLLRTMYGNQPHRWSNRLKGEERLRVIINTLTRLRFCDKKGNMALREKGGVGTQKPPYMPWFQVPGRKSAEEKIIFGHWSTLGYLHADNVWALDTGCLWGGQLTALKLRKRKKPKPHFLDCPGVKKPG